MKNRNEDTIIGVKRANVNGSFIDNEKSCLKCKSFFLWGRCIGLCMEEGEDTASNETCEKFIETKED